MLRRQKHALSQSTTPFACTLGLCMGGFPLQHQWLPSGMLTIPPRVCVKYSNRYNVACALAFLQGWGSNVGNFCRLWANGVVRKWGRTDLTGFYFFDPAGVRLVPLKTRDVKEFPPDFNRFFDRIPWDLAKIWLKTA